MTTSKDFAADQAKEGPSVGDVAYVETLRMQRNRALDEIASLRAHIATQDAEIGQQRKALDALLSRIPRSEPVDELSISQRGR